MESRKARFLFTLHLNFFVLGETMERKRISNAGGLWKEAIKIENLPAPTGL